MFFQEVLAESILSSKNLSVLVLVARSGSSEVIERLKKDIAQPAFTCTKLTIETLEEGVKCSKLTIKTPERRHWRGQMPAGRGWVIIF